MSVGAQLGSIQRLEDRVSNLILPLPQATKVEREKLGKIVDNINLRFGSDTVSFGHSKPHDGFFEKG